ncbi:hypothetical protein E3E12_08545 [Formicincola oecophyllae]|uniref:Uncharacterized protein n=1 Tax=Formicincola oecophyllae TaxID=2558361 RepID=A0A4Y6UCE0_9PROT|nr:hypothetical protein [Formicincola oecophyllae]QDH14228.1 hypothetical protein E3E12_08545 [Formicincola oecophyllae]
MALDNLPNTPPTDPPPPTEGLQPPQPDEPWFEQKKGSYGSSWPVTWQGWLVIAALVLALMLSMELFRGWVRLGALLACVLVFGGVTWFKTTSKGNAP